MALSRATDSSVLNILPATIDSVRDEGRDTVTLSLRLAAVNGVPASLILARLTRRSHETLRLAVGQQVYAQIKGAALMG